MDTVYYNLNARRVKVSGGEELVTFVPAPAPRPAGEVLDFARCRQKLERKAAWQNLTRAALEGPEPRGAAAPNAAAARPAASRRSRAADQLELAATLAVALVSLAAALAFFSLV